MTEITAELVSLYDMAMPLATCVNTRARNWQELLSDAGTASLTFQKDDPDLAEVVAPNTLVNFLLDGTLAFTALLETFEAVILDAGGGAVEATIWRGRGHLALLERGLIYPALALGSRPIENDRGFNWQAAIYDWVGNGAVPATALCSVLQAQTGTWPEPWDSNFAHNAADVLGPSSGSTSQAPAGACYYQQTVVVLIAGLYEVQVLMDNYGEVYFDGALLMSPGQDSGQGDGFSKVEKRSLQLTPGLHTINARAFNASYGVLNPTGYAFCVAVLNPDGTTGAVIAASSVADGALIFEYPAAPPGMTPGAAILVALNECRNGTALGGGRASGDPLAAVNLISCSFDAVNDSAGNPWPLYANITTTVGQTLLGFLRELSATYIDFSMTPGVLELNAWIHGQRGGATAVDFHPPTDPRDAESGNISRLVSKGEA